VLALCALLLLWTAYAAFKRGMKRQEQEQDRIPE